VKPAKSANKNLQDRKTSIKRIVAIYSVILFSIIFVSGSVVFWISMQQIVHTNVSHELAQAVEIERIKLEASVNGEIAIALKMADSPVIQSYFSNPSNSELERIALQEIAGYRRAFASKSVFWVNDIDHRFYSDETYAFTLDINDPGNYWYKMTLYETEKFNFNINYNPELNVTNLWINAPVFDADRNPIGILGTGIDLTAFINMIYKNYKGSASLYLFNAAGEITGAKDSSLVSNKVILDKELGATGTEILIRALDIKDGEIHTFGAPDAEIAVGNIPTLGWYITAIQPLSISNILSNVITIVFFAMIAVIAAIFITFIVLIGWMLKPLNSMITTLDKISADWDLTRQVSVKNKDETGILGAFFNLTFGKMRELIVNIKKETVALLDTGDELSSSMNETKTDVEGINSNIQNMREHVLSQADKVNSTANSIDHIKTGLGKLDEHITVQADNVAQSSSAIEQMLASIHTVTQTLVKNTANIKSLAESSEVGRIDLQKVSADIQDISKESESLLEINSVMQNISSQTNLLSMNAAIEAAHAGESGQGFAVVADEIRKLAENSGNQSKTISAVLKRIKTMIDAITKSTGVVLEQFNSIEEEVRIVSNQENQIRSAMEEQEEGSRQILEAMTHLNSVTGLVQRASAEMITESKEIMKQSTDLKRITSDVAGSMDEMTQSVDKISSAVVRVQEITIENKENIDRLSEDIKRFKVE